MRRFRKKPVEVEACQLPDPRINPALGPHSEALCREIADWCGGEMVDDAVDGPCILINTLEGQMKAIPGDWIIQGVAGEFYPCKPEIFAATYDEVEG